MTRLLLLVPTLSSYEAFLSDFADAALGEGYEVHVATQMKLLDGREREESKRLSGKVCFHSVPMPRGVSMSGIVQSAKAIRRLVGDIRPDWIQAHFSVAALILAVAKGRDWPYTSSIIQGLASTTTTGISRWLSFLGEWFATMRLDEMWVLTEDDFAVTRSWCSAKAKLQVAPGFGCRLEEFDPGDYSDAWRGERLSELSLAPEKFTMIFVGRLAAFKGFDKVVRAYWELRSRGLPVQLILLGAYDNRHPTGLTAQEIGKLEDDSSVVLPGWQEAVAQWLAIADVCVFPSDREGMPVCLMESIAMGVPVVTSDSRGCRDVVRHQVDGLLLNPCRVPQLVETIEHLIVSDEALRVMKEATSDRREFFGRANYIEEQLTHLKVVVPPTNQDQSPNRNR